MAMSTCKVRSKRLKSNKEAVIQCRNETNALAINAFKTSTRDTSRHYFFVRELTQYGRPIGNYPSTP